MKRLAPLCALLLIVACGSQKEYNAVIHTSSSSIPAASSAARLSAAGTVRLRSLDGMTLSVAVEIARTPAEQATGLMGRTSLAADTGMLFVFPKEHTLDFWMKDTLIPLDILFFDATGAFVSSASMTPCPEGTACQRYRSARPALYALEVPAGYAWQHKIDTGWMMQIADAR